MKRALVLLANGFEEVEALSVVDVLRRGNVDCKICSIDRAFVCSGFFSTFAESFDYDIY